MTERELFSEALDKPSPAERAAYLDAACAGDPALRERVEALLRSHEGAGAFLVGSAPERLASGPVAAETRTGPAAPDGGDGLDFLAPSDSPGSIGRLGHYEVREVVGRGGMGVVLRAFDERLHRVVAIKVMAAPLATSAIARQRFTREARAAAAVSHDHIVTIHAVEEANGLPYLVMQFVAGMSLQERLDRTGPLDPREIARIGMQAASGLAAAHAQGLVHRDVKPSNILLENGVERVKITDFGLARAIDDASLTQSGTIAGTPHYMSPEQARGEAVDHRADLFSLGSVLYAMCTGRPPFRAGNNMAVLKRVCEGLPTPVREVSPDVPEWLVAVIDKLHAKNPADRFQSAAEVAEVIGRNLVDLQRPSVAPMPTVAPRARRRRWVVAVAALLCLAGGLGLTEASGVTKIRATVMRVFTPAGTQDLQVGREADPLNAEKADAQAFVLLGAKGVEVRKCATLAEAVLTAGDGDTIEIRGNGPFVTEPVNIGEKALVIRAGMGFRPVIELSPAGLEARVPVLATDARLVLEGLELRRMVLGSWKEGEGNDKDAVLYAPKAPLQVGNCRLLTRHHQAYGCGNPSVCSFLNCEILCSDGLGVSTDLQPGSRLTIENCIQSYLGIGFADPLDGKEPTTVRLTHNTCIGNELFFAVWLCFKEVPASRLRQGQPKALRVEATGNVFNARNLMDLVQILPDTNFPSRDAETFVKQHLDWRGQQNLYALSSDFLVEGKSAGPEVTILIPSAKGLAGWKQFWNSTETDSLEGRVRYQGGDVLTKLRVAPYTVTPDDFRLRPDSPGYRAGKDGKDLGADIDLVGPGPAYERWKKTPGYQQWLKDTKQAKVDPPAGERQAFVLLGAKGVEVRKYDTLAEAVRGASDGDTIEIRGNGPFVVAPIKITLPLRIRAGEGFRPVIKLSPEGLRAHAPLLEAEAALVLEGLELQRMAQDRKEGEPWQVVLTAWKDLHVANCRFLMRKNFACIEADSPVAELRNCEFLCQEGLGGGTLAWLVHQPGQRLVIHNCLLTEWARINSYKKFNAKGAVVQFTHNTFRTRQSVLWFAQEFDALPVVKDVDQQVKLNRIEVSANIFDSSSVFDFEQGPPDKILPPPEAERHLTHMFGWEGERNLYAARGPFIRFDTSGKQPSEPALVSKLVDWRRFWATTETNSIEGRARYQGGELLAKLEATPEQLTPEDWRLRPDSPGYRAGKDGKDLGADIDLVGPGPAYERWKKTPGYQQWLKDTGQGKK